MPHVPPEGFPAILSWGANKAFKLDQVVCADKGILIIDDDVDYCCLVQIAFQEVRVTRLTQAVHDGRAALHLLSQLAPGEVGGLLPGLILLDLRMPGLSGVEVLRWIRTQPFLADVPVVVFTGLEAGNEISEAIALGATIHAKPFSYRELVREANELRMAYLEPVELNQAA